MDAWPVCLFRSSATWRTTGFRGGRDRLGVVVAPMMATIINELQPVSPRAPVLAAARPAKEHGQVMAIILKHDHLNRDTIQMDGVLRVAPRLRQPLVIVSPALILE
jgi:hypothetical protein